MQRTLKRELKGLEIVKREALEAPNSCDRGQSRSHNESTRREIQLVFCSRGSPSRPRSSEEASSLGGGWKHPFSQRGGAWFLLVRGSRLHFERRVHFSLRSGEPASVSETRSGSFSGLAGQDPRVNSKVVLSASFPSKGMPKDDTRADILTADETEGKRILQTRAARHHACPGILLSRGLPCLGRNRWCGETGFSRGISLLSRL